ncbi:MAG: PAS domain-containing protein [Candidatus Hodarchaeales archaeon]
MELNKALAEDKLKLLDSMISVKDVLNLSSDGMFILNKNYLILELNDRAMELIKVNKKEITGKHFIKSGIFHPQDVADLKEQFTDLIRGKKQSESDDQVFLECRSSIIKTNDNDDFTIVTLKEERKILEKALLKSEERYRTVVENQSELISRIRPDLKHIFVNEAYCRFFGKELKELKDISILHFIPEDEHEQVKQKFSSMNIDNPSISLEHHVIDAQGNLKRYHGFGRG